MGLFLGDLANFRGFPQGHEVTMVNLGDLDGVDGLAGFLSGSILMGSLLMGSLLIGSGLDSV